MMTPVQARSFADAWISAWNSHDLDQVLAHYDDDFEMSSPFIRQVAGKASGTLRGKAEVAAYWRRAIERFPDLRFTLERVLAGVDSLALYYHASVSGGMACEVLSFGDNGLVVKGHAHYEVPAAP